MMQMPEPFLVWCEQAQTNHKALKAATTASLLLKGIADFEIQGLRGSQVAEASNEFCLVHHVCSNLHSPHLVHHLKEPQQLCLIGLYCR